MSGWVVVCRKELSDHLGSKRFLLLFGLILVLSLSSAYQGVQAIRGNPSGVFINIFSGSYILGVQFSYVMYLFGPIIGLALSFDSINRERSQGSLSVLLSQPIFRDSIINGKFLAGVGALSLVSVATVGIMSGVAIPLLGFGPGPDEIMRIVLFTLITILYLTVWLAIGLFFSTLTRKTSTSILLSLSVWAFSVIILSVIAMLIANFVVPTQTSYSASSGMDTFGSIDAKFEVYTSILRISPALIYQEAVTSIIDVSTSSSSSGTLITYSSEWTQQDLLVIWPHVVVLVTVVAVCFAASYMLFLRQEIRAGN